ncbi:MAG: MarR family transcriptional regulator [Bacteroidota bacterium]
MIRYYQTIHQIITSGHWITSSVNKELKEFGMTEPQYNVLRILKGAKGKPLTGQEIQANMVQQNSNVTRIIDKLIKLGYVQRQACPSNRRKLDITIQKEGLIILEKLDQKVHQFHQPMTENLTKEELVTLKRLIQRLTKNS